MYSVSVWLHSTVNHNVYLLIHFDEKRGEKTGRDSHMDKITQRKKICPGRDMKCEKKLKVDSHSEEEFEKYK